jgi:ADP-ribose pyrophosphatase
MTNKGVRDGGSPAYPTVRWKNEWATFVEADATPAGEGAPATPAALVFPFYGDRVVLADIRTRGWCIPSGHIEAGETAEQAVRREAEEEAGAVLGRVAHLGYFVLTHAESGEVRHAPTFVAEVASLGGPPTGGDSQGMQMVNVEDVASLYFAWDALLAAVFTRAYEKKQEDFPAGIPLAALTGEG